MNLFLDKLSFLSCGSVPSARKRRAGSTRVESDAKLLTERFKSSKVWKKVRSDGKVHSPFYARFSTYRLGNYPSYGKWPGGMLL